MGEEAKNVHFVLVHGLCHGAWAWYKVKPLLESAGHRVTALDMTGCGIHPKPIKEATMFEHYTEPLLDFMESVEGKVVLVGHSIGGLCLALAMDRFPEKVSVAIFTAAFMPDTKNAPSFVIDKFSESTTPEDWLDSEFEPHGEEMLVLSRSQFIEQKLYTSSPKEDIELAKHLLRQSCMFEVDLKRSEKFKDEAYGSVKKAYIICKEDVIFPEEFQRWFIENYPVDEVVEIVGSDHVPMLSKPQELTDSLIRIANKYA